MDDARTLRLRQIAQAHYEWSQHWSDRAPADGREDGPVHHVDAWDNAEAHDDFAERLGLREA